MNCKYKAWAVSLGNGCAGSRFCLSVTFLVSMLHKKQVASMARVVQSYGGGGGSVDLHFHQNDLYFIIPKENAFFPLSAKAQVFNNALWFYLNKKKKSFGTLPWNFYLMLKSQFPKGDFNQAWLRLTLVFLKKKKAEKGKTRNSAKSFFLGISNHMPELGGDPFSSLHWAVGLNADGICLMVFKCSPEACSANHFCGKQSGPRPARSTSEPLRQHPYEEEVSATLFIPLKL